MASEVFRGDPEVQQANTGTVPQNTTLLLSAYRLFSGALIVKNLTPCDRITDK